MFVSCCYPVHLTTELVYQNEFHILHCKILEKSTPLCNGKGSNANKAQDSETSLLVSKKVDKNSIEDTETTPKSCLDVVFDLLATTAGTSSSKSLPESVWLLEFLLEVESQEAELIQAMSSKSWCQQW